jgi:hypothetical protein
LLSSSAQINFIMRFIALFLLLALNTTNHLLFAQANIIVLKGGTVIDLDSYGNSSKDVKNAVVVIQDRKITAVGTAGKIKIPANATVIDITGKYVVPGLIEGFGSVANQAFANAYLYMGVTTVITVEDNRRGKTFTTASPSPVLYKQDAYWGADRVEVTNKPYRFDNINYRDAAGIKKEIDSMAKEGAKVMLIHYGVKPEQLKTIVATCKALNIATIGELGFTSYREAVDAGIQSFVHTSRYTADILPDSVRNIYSYAPFGPPASFYYDFIAKPGIISNPRLTELSKLYATHPVGLMPTGSLIVYTNMAFARNPWKETVASIIDEKDITHEPLDKTTGKPKNPSPLRAKAAHVMFSMDSLFANRGAHFLTGSGATAFGTMPGISLHTELEFLSHVGLTNRQAIAAATTNFSVIWNWKHIGKIEAGRDANILVLSRNPLDSLDNLKEIDLLFVEGKQIERDQLLKK